MDNTGSVDQQILSYTIMLKDVEWLWGLGGRVRGRGGRGGCGEVTVCWGEECLPGQWSEACGPPYPLTEQMKCRGDLGWYRPTVELASPSVFVCGCVLSYLQVWRWWHVTPV